MNYPPASDKSMPCQSDGEISHVIDDLFYFTELYNYHSGNDDDNLLYGVEIISDDGIVLVNIEGSTYLIDTKTGE